MEKERFGDETPQKLRGLRLASLPKLLYNK